MGVNFFRSSTRPPRWSGSTAAGLIVGFLVVLCSRAPAGQAGDPNAPAGAGVVPEAAPVAPNGSASLDGVAAEELALFQEIPVVVSASRQAQPANWLSAPVSVVTAEDIYYSGATSIPEALQFVPGVDALQIDRNRWAIGVHGLHARFSDRTLTLVDGRSADSPVFGGSEFFRLPLMMEDIERIEVVRGPGGAVWGANAFNGVINIITKDPNDMEPGVLASTTWNHFGDSYNHARWVHRAGRWSWFTSLGYQHRESSDEAIDDDDFVSRDFSRNWRARAEATYRSSEWTRLKFGLGYSHMERGDFEYGLYQPGRDERLETIRGHVRLEHDFSDDVSGYLQWYTNHSDNDQPSLTQFSTCENDLEGQLNFTIAEDHDVSVGGNLRWIHLRQNRQTPKDIILNDVPGSEYWAGIFAIDRWQASDSTVLEGQIRGDYYSQTHFDWSGRLSWLQALDSRKNHVLRLSGARAFRAPLSGLTALEAYRIPLPGPPMYPPDSHGFSLVSNDKLDNEQIYSIELGYNGQLGDHLKVQADGYFQEYNSLIGFELKQRPPLVPGRIPLRTLRTRNKGMAQAYGGELQATVEFPSWRATAWYAYNEFSGGDTVRAYAPAKHKAGLSSRAFLPRGWTLDMDYKAVSRTGTSGKTYYPDVESYHQMDLSVSKKLFKDGELTVGVNDLFDETELVVGDNGTISTIHKTPGRTWFVRMQWEF